MTKAVFLYVPWTTRQDPTAFPTYEAKCVTGDETDCGAESGPKLRPQDVETWMDGHLRDTGHTRYLRVFSDYAITQREGEPPLEPVRRPHLEAANGGHG